MSRALSINRFNNDHQATGNLGPAILHALLEAGFQVTVLSRHDSPRADTLPAAAAVARVDYASTNALTVALQGHDAVVSTLGSAAVATAQPRLIEAAIAAGVRRFLPSEFGGDIANPHVRAITIFAPTLAAQDALRKEAARKGGMSFTLVCCGLFFDWAIQRGFLMDLKKRSITLYDGGHTIFSTTTLATVGAAVAGVLRRPVETRNRAVYVQDTSTTLNRLLAMGKAAVGADGWTETAVPMQTVVGGAYAEMKKEAPNPRVFAMGFIKAVVFGEEYGCYFWSVDNELLGIKEKTDAEVQEMINGLADSP